MGLNLLYLIGPPAAGKSSVMSALTAGCERVSFMDPFAHDYLLAATGRLKPPGQGETVAVELGRHRPDFPGTDTLPLNVAPVANQWIATKPHPLVLAEGDRLAHQGFLDAATNAGYAVTLVYLTTDQDTLDARCAARGSQQNQSWRKGRATKAARLADSKLYRTLRFGGNGTPAQITNSLRMFIPALDALPKPKLHIFTLPEVADGPL